MACGFWPGRCWGRRFSWQTAARFAVWTERYDGELVDLTACVEDLRPGYTQDTVRARLRVQTANGEAADFCCWCDDLPLCQAGDRITGRFLLEAPSMDSRADRYADGGGVRRPTTSGGSRRSARRPDSGLVGAAADPPQRRPLPGSWRGRAGALAAMIVGDRTRISQELNDDYRAAGLSHVLVVSGMHVTLLCGFLKPGLLEEAPLAGPGPEAGHLPAGTERFPRLPPPGSVSGPGGAGDAPARGGRLARRDPVAAAAGGPVAGMSGRAAVRDYRGLRRRCCVRWRRWSSARWAYGCWPPPTR